MGKMSRDIDFEFIKPERPPDWFDVHKAKGAHFYDAPKQAFRDGLRAFPNWSLQAMKWRNFVVRPFGLKTEAPTNEGANLLHALPVYRDTATAFEAGLTDKHLTFSIDVRFEADDILFTTNIWFNHPLGRVYLAIVYFPHKLIMRAATRNLSSQV